MVDLLKRFNAWLNRTFGGLHQGIEVEDPIEIIPLPFMPQAIQSPTSSSLDAAVEIVKRWEGYRSKAYQCSAMRWTIGYGTTVYPPSFRNGRNVRPGDVITKPEAEFCLMHDINTIRVPAIMRMVSVPLHPNQMAALISLVYNIGVGSTNPRSGFAGSTLRRLLNEGYPANTVASQFDVWVRAKGQVIRGLVNRRKDEKALFLKR